MRASTALCMCCSARSSCCTWCIHESMSCILDEAADCASNVMSTLWRCESYRTAHQQVTPSYDTLEWHCLLQCVMWCAAPVRWLLPWWMQPPPARECVRVCGNCLFLTCWQVATSVTVLPQDTRPDATCATTAQLQRVITKHRSMTIAYLASWCVVYGKPPVLPWLVTLQYGGPGRGVGGQSD